MKRVVSVSLGSSKRDKSSAANILGEDFEISRVGTDGDKEKFAALIKELDGKVDAIGLGGIDRYLWVDDRKYTIRDADKLARCARVSPLVDGSGVKDTVERLTVKYLQENSIVDFASSKVLVVAGVDRFGMAQSIAALSQKVIFGDLMFAVGLPIPLRSYAALRVLASLLLPIIVRLPFNWIYPTGSSQEVDVPKYTDTYRWADVIAGDYLMIKRFMPDSNSDALQGKIILSNTLTEEDTNTLKERGATLLITGTPKYDGRHYATNVLEAIMVAMMQKRPEELTKSDYEALLERMNWAPTITNLAE